MVETYRPIPLDMEVVFKTLVEGIKSYVHQNHINVVVLGLSGGIDSTVVAALCKAGNIPLIGVSLPCSTNADVENAKKPLSHASLIKASVEGTYPYGDNGSDGPTEAEVSKKSKITSKKGNIQELELFNE